MKPLIFVLSLVCAALAAQLILRNGSSSRSTSEIAAANTRAIALSNEVHEARNKASEEAKLATYLQSNLTQRASEFAAATNQLAQASATLAALQNELTVARAESGKNATRVNELESQKDELQAKLKELASSIEALNLQITETKRKLAAAEGDRDSLTKELAKLQADKSDLLSRFNDIAALRAQLTLLRDEAAINQRLIWMREGVYQTAGRKGAEALITKPAPGALVGDPSLNVEIQEKPAPAK
jgi:chromosome segregation ATPase